MTSALLQYRRLLIGLWHAAVISFTMVAAFLLRFDFSIARADTPFLLNGLWLALLVKMTVFQLARLDRGWWRYAGMPDLLRVLTANTVASALFASLSYIVTGPGFPRSIYFIDFLICFVATAGGRFSVRLYQEALAGELSKPGCKGLLIYGAGMAGHTLLKEIRANPLLGYEVVGFLDDNRAKRNEDLLGVPVLGAGRDAAMIVDQSRNAGRRIEEILIAMPNATGRQMQEALANCRAAGVPCKTIPGIGQLLNDKVLSGQIRNVAITDLLGREAVQLETDRIRSAIAGRSVLVTGAGGSIGSELCRQIAECGPRKLVLLDQAESDLFKVDLELRNAYRSVLVAPEVGDIRDYPRVEEAINRHSVDSIFHAAAYKHVPLMESHVIEAVKNNVIGTWNVAQAARRNGAADFLMISSDKAVNPVNIMGVTKRVAELIVSSLDGAGTRFVSVRFGNVLGSNGSVAPLFQEQIARGGPVTVTHPDVRRYFMTVREAVQLVLQASTMGKGSEIFVLDMGEPIRLVELARNMIRLSGRVPDEEIEIRFIGLRPGEKLSEELITHGEHIRPTYHDKIKIFQGAPVNYRRIEQSVRQLELVLAARDEAAVVACLKELVPEYQPSSQSTVGDAEQIAQVL